jgi:pSer/pThr/pTyr-binding forkhead associated (FHA) protein
MLYQLRITYLRGSKLGSVETFPLPNRDGELKIGRDPSCGVRFDAYLDPLVSRHHASIHWRDPTDERESDTDADPDMLVERQFELVDLVSSNGTFVNGKRIEAGHDLSSGDLVQFGNTGPQIRIEILRENVIITGTPTTQSFPAIES